MFKLSFIILILFFSFSHGQSPHGKDFNIACENCHTTESWKIEENKIQFDHDKTFFPLTGQHEVTNCKSCHLNLVFDTTSDQCFECHKDAHQNTVGNDCERCHQTTSWLVNKISEIHQMSRFPLLGEHLTADCNECHASASNVLFEPLGVDCKFCHLTDFNSANNPDHIVAGFSTECQDCHDLNAEEWGMSNFAHDFFPLVEVHNIANCFECHQQNSFSGLSSECNSCHINRYNSTTNPNHVELSFSTNCSECHTLTPGWSPAEFTRHNEIYPLLGAHAEIKNDCNSCHTNGYSNTPNQCIGCHQSDFNSTTNPSHVTLNFSTNCEDCHSLGAWTPATFDHDGQFFPIYSGEHNGVWDACSDCHTDQNNYTNFSCVTCHEHNQNEMDQEHNGVSGYVYESNQCYACHPTGSGEGAFNHATSAFPLIGMHAQVSCEDCHTSGYLGTSSDCYSCHQNDYQNTTNPSHQTLGLDFNCETCHTFEPDWKPAQFPVHANYYELLGAHLSISNDCSTCHNNDYNNTPNLCIGCHQSDYDNTVDPPHQASGFATDCEVCHTQDSWTPATFEHDGQYFPIYTGSHVGEWEACSDCHTVQSNYKVFECINCHEHNQTDTDNEHSGITGYLYASNECYACHPDGTGEGFDHSLSNFPLTGSHINVECGDCHISGYSGTSSDCYSCHQQNFQNTTNPNHQILGLDTSCETCHTTEPGWVPAQFPIHNNYYQLLGAHASISNDCTGCHNNDYNNTPDQCVGCHQQDYDQTSNPNHSTSGFTTDCESCHTQEAWTPATFDHAQSNFPLTGAHVTVECQSCHTNGYSGTSTDCYSCHKTDFDGTTNPKHSASGFSTDCQACHTTAAWEPATFDHNTSNFPLTGAHVTVECQSCHTNGYSGTSTDCYSCHKTDFDGTTDPNHSASGFSTDCESCHSTSAWEPSTFDHDSQFFPIYSGEHRNEWNTCADCHTVASNYQIFECIYCHDHRQSEMDSEHNDVNNYQYLSTACYNCHPNGSE